MLFVGLLVVGALVAHLAGPGFEDFNRLGVFGGFEQDVENDRAVIKQQVEDDFGGGGHRPLAEPGHVALLDAPGGNEVAQLEGKGRPDQLAVTGAGFGDFLEGGGDGDVPRFAGVFGLADVGAEMVTVAMPVPVFHHGIEQLGHPLFTLATHWTGPRRDCRGREWPGHYIGPGLSSPGAGTGADDGRSSARCRPRTWSGSA